MTRKSTTIVTIIALIAAVASIDSVAQDESSRMAPDADPDGVLGSHRNRNMGADRESPGMGMMLVQRIDVVNSMIDQNALQSALTELQELANRPKLNELEMAVIDMLLGYVHGDMKDYDLAIDSYTRALESLALPTPSHQGALYSLAHLHAAKLDFEKAIETMLDWFQFETEPFAEAYMFMGSNYVALERYETSVPWLERAIENAERPIEDWYQVTYSVYVELEQFDKAIPLLKTMIGYWSRMPEYWQALAGLYRETGDDRAAYDTTMTAYVNGMLRTEQTVLTLVDMSLIYDTPYAAGSILENEMIAGVVEERESTLTILADIWVAAREYDKAVVVLGKMAEYGDPAIHYMRAAQLQMQSGDFRGAAQSAEKALEAGVEDRVNALVVAGSAYSELGEWESSAAAFRQVAEIGDDNDRRNAENWIRFVEESRQLTLSALP